MIALNEFNAIVLHRVIDGNPVNFIDVNLDSLRFILSKSKYNFCSIDKAFEKKHQENADICLTFDDGFLSDYELVLPELQKINATATFFIVTDYLDTPGYLKTWQVKSLSQLGMQIGSHSQSHPSFLELTAAERLEELRNSKEILEKIIDKKVTSFSFPFGFYDNECIEAVFSAGYSICCTSKHGISSKSDVVVPRNAINAKTSLNRIGRVLNADLTQRCSWYMEDVIKSLLKRSFPKFYVILRNLLSRF